MFSPQTCSPHHTVSDMSCSYMFSHPLYLVLLLIFFYIILHHPCCLIWLIRMFHMIHVWCMCVQRRLFPVSKKNMWRQSVCEGEGVCILSNVIHSSCTNGWPFASLTDESVCPCTCAIQDHHCPHLWGVTVNLMFVMPSCLWHCKTMRTLNICI